VLKEMHATTEPDRVKAIKDFDEAFFSHVGFVFSNIARSTAHGWTGGRMAPASEAAAPEMRRYYRAVSRLSAAFALLTDLSMFVLGGSLKRRERISGRLGDILSQMYLISAALKRYEDDGRPAADAPYVHWSIQDALVKAQQALIGVLHNFPNRALAGLVHMLVFPFGLPYRNPSDSLGTAVAEAMQTAGESRDRLLADSFVQGEIGDPISCGEMAFALLSQVEAIEKRLKPAIQSGILTPIPQSLVSMQEWVTNTATAGMLNAEEQRTMSDFARFTDTAVQVDDFPQDFNASSDAAKRQLVADRQRLHAL
jgi:acyl-CoA dehydrogenase